jgi:hypothetical protein
MRRTIALLTVLVMVCSVAVPAGVVAAESAPQAGVTESPAVADTETNQTTADHPPDPESDRLGWENGYWYNETLSVTAEDGLNDSELDRVVARSMARVEVIRGLEFNGTVPVEVISREEFREEQNGSSTNTSTANRLHQNVKWEAMLSIGESENALQTTESTRSATVGGYYSPSEDRIVIVSENTTTPQMDEITLSQELFHALQDQTLRISFNRSTQEGINARNGIVEGDGNLVDRLYEQRCGEGWDCVIPESDGSNGGGSDTSDINFGIYLTQYQPYSDGPKFVQQIRRKGGWEAVNDVYENPPTSSEQVIHTEKYPEEGPVNITFEDTSSESWYVPDMGNGSVDYARYGQAGLSAMFMRTAYAQQGTPVVSPQEFLNITDGGISDFDPLNYGLDLTNGWGNDKLYPYATNDSIETNETGYVWQIEWDTEDDASEFANGYVDLLEYYGGQAVAGNESTYRIPDENEFGDAFYVGVEGSTVMLVNGPNVSSLPEIRAGAAPAVETTFGETTTPSNGETPTPSNGETTTSPNGETTSASNGETRADDTGSGFGPGFGVLAALGTVVAAGLVALRRRN